jgi:Tfp pilus assembly protein PilN
MNQPPNEDTTWMIEVQTDTIIQLSNELEAAKQRIAELECQKKQHWDRVLILEQKISAYAFMLKELNETNILLDKISPPNAPN